MPGSRGRVCGSKPLLPYTDLVALADNSDGRSLIERKTRIWRQVPSWREALADFVVKANRVLNPLAVFCQTVTRPKTERATAIITCDRLI
ncbi:MAG: hypothetical protein JWO15_2710 [Sphingomonadales bacterium]|nr:hypothetical protein [Sphingomonadales bacterium]